MELEEDPICPVCYTGVLQPMGDMAGHLVCTVCHAQSQDVILEEVDDFVAAEDRGYLLASRPAVERKVAEVKTIDPQAEVMVYLECLQRLLQAQQDVIAKWFSCKAYNGVLKQIWKLAVLHSGLLNVGHLKAVEDPNDIAGEWEPNAEEQLDGNSSAKKQRKAVKVSANATNLGTILYTCTKLPIWARDVMEAARDGELPYIAAISLCEDLLEGHPVAQRALRHPNLATSDAGLVAITHALASSINVVIPELNLGARCARLMLLLLAHEHATIVIHSHHHWAEGLLWDWSAVHTRTPMQVNTREHGMPEHVKKRVGSSWASAQLVQVFLPIMAVCKHLLKIASMKEDVADHLTADAMRPWVQAGQRLLELRQLKYQQRFQMALHDGVDQMLNYTQHHSLHDSHLPSMLAKPQQSLRDYANELEQQGPSRKQTRDDQGLCGDVLHESGDAGDIASQVYAQLVRLIAVEIGLDVSTLDVMAVQYYKDLLP